MEKKLISIIFLVSLLYPTLTLASYKAFQVDTGGTLTTSLVSYYKLEDVNDFWSTNNLTNNASVAFNAGKINNAADAGASNTTKYLNNTGNLGIDGGAVSMAGWVNVTTQPGTGVLASMFSQGSTASQVGYIMYYRDIAGTKYFTWDRLKANVSDTLAQQAWTATAGTWYHVAGTYDGTNIFLYINGVQYASTTASGNGASGINQGFSIFNNTPQTGNFFSGLTDELGVWNRALTQQEITDLYNGGSGQTMTTVSSPVQGVASFILQTASLILNSGTLIIK